jgi:hypothetical protein
MLEWATGDGSGPGEGPNRRIIATARKLRLFAVALCRQVWDGKGCRQCRGTGKELLPIYGEGQASSTAVEPTGYSPIMNSLCPSCCGTGRIDGLTDPLSRHAVEIAEKYADGKASRRERLDALYAMPNAGEACWKPAYRVAGNCCFGDGWQQWIPLCEELHNLGWLDYARQADLLRDIFGNPFRPYIVVTPVPVSDGYMHRKRDGRLVSIGEVGKVRLFSNEWLTETVVNLAQVIYDERAWDRMPVLGDALEDADCTKEEVLQHCRGHTPHARGCWVVDLLLGKE